MSSFLSGQSPVMAAVTNSKAIIGTEGEWFSSSSWKMKENARLPAAIDLICWRLKRSQSAPSHAEPEVNDTVLLSKTIIKWQSRLELHLDTQ